MLRQIVAVTMLNLRSIPQRAGMSIATVLSIALVVAVLLGFMAMANGFRATIDGVGAEDIAVILRAGALAESNSVLSMDEVRLIQIAPGIARDATGDPVLTAESYVIVNGTRRDSGSESNVALRGVESHAPDLRAGFAISEGRMFAPGAGELLVGESVQREFSGFDVGQTVRLGSNEWRIVGTFTTGGTVFDSEIWADLGVIQNLYQRGSSVQMVRANLESPAALAQLREYAENESRLNLEILSEREFFARSAGGTTDLIMYLGWPLAIAMAIGALAGAWNAMYSSVDARTREIATLRAIGFSGFPAFVGAMVESLLLAGAGGLIGAFATWAIFDGISTSTLGSNFTQVVFSFAVTGSAVANGIFLALLVGFFGGLVPALRAARVPLLAVHDN